MVSYATVRTLFNIGYIILYILTLSAVILYPIFSIATLVYVFMASPNMPDNIYNHTGILIILLMISLIATVFITLCCNYLHKHKYNYLSYLTDKYYYRNIEFITIVA